MNKAKKCSREVRERAVATAFAEQIRHHGCVFFLA